MKKAAVMILVFFTLVVFGCNNVQRKPAPDPEPRLIPQESTIGFSQVDIDQVPASVQKVASAMEKRLMLTWAYDNNNSYILINTGQDGEPVKVNKVIQRVPVQDFLWLDVQLEQLDNDEGKKNENLVVVKLKNTDKAINGVGFELREEEEEDSEEGKPQAAPTPAPTTRQPANQAKPAPPREIRAEEKQPPNQLPEEDNETNDDENDDEQKKPTPGVPNGD